MTAANRPRVKAAVQSGDHALPVYEMSVNVRVTWQAHSLSNAGSNGSIRLLARRQLLADGTETDACSGNIAKHHHAMLLAEYLESAGIPLCPACASRDGRRASALVGLPGYKSLSIERILTECALCDAHGFLVTAKNASSDGSTERRQRISKHSLIEFSFALALPDRHAESTHLYTRSGNSKEDGQMWMKMPARSGEYALCIRYKSAGIGVDTDKWRVVVDDAGERARRHRAILSALCDQLLSPDGALTAAALPHLTGLVGALVVRSSVGRAPVFSPLDADFVARLTALSDKTCQVFPFDTAEAFKILLNRLIETSSPCLPVIPLRKLVPPADAKKKR
jgi:CRISPR-associated autoregulator DevR family